MNTNKLFVIAALFATAMISGCASTPRSSSLPKSIVIQTDLPSIQNAIIEKHQNDEVSWTVNERNESELILESPVTSFGDMFKYHCQLCRQPKFRKTYQFLQLGEGVSVSPYLEVIEGNPYYGDVPHSQNNDQMKQDLIDIKTKLEQPN